MRRRRRPASGSSSAAVSISPTACRCWSIRPTAGLFAALPAAVARQEARRQGEMPSRMGRSRRLCEG
jgi:hypothetical protein